MSIAVRSIELSDLTRGDRVLIGLAWGWLLIALPFVSDAACDFLIFLFLFASGLVLGLAWIIMTFSQPRLLRPTAAKWWITVPAAGLLCVILTATDDDLALRVACSEWALNHRVENARRCGLDDDETKWIGLFSVHGTEVFDGGVYFYTSVGFIDHYGVANIPAGRKRPPKTSIEHLYGDWYKFRRKF